MSIGRQCKPQKSRSDLPLRLFIGFHRRKELKMGSEYKYLYEMHCHTRQVSLCGRFDAVEHIKHYKQLGYSGGVFTDHLLNSACRISKELSWEEQVETMYASYKDAIDYAKSVDYRLFIAWEWGNDGMEMLTYGLDKDWLLKHPEIVSLKGDEYCKTAREGGAFLSQPHPFRAPTAIIKIAKPELVDAIEVLNATNPECANNAAEALAKEFGYKCTAGSDNHVGYLPSYCALAFKENPKDYAQFLQLLRSDDYEIRTLAD